MTMGQAAAMTYLRVIREERGLSQDDIARVIGHTKKQVSRWETCEQEPTSTGLAQFVAAVRANADQVLRLFIDTQVTPEEARQMAREWLSQEAIGEIDRRAALLSDEERAAALQILGKLLARD